jgi:hypothetical protein
MDQNITLENILKYYYQECSAQERIVIENKINTDKEYKRIYDEFVQLINTVSSSKSQPEQSTIDKIMNYSRSGLPVEG